MGLEFQPLEQRHALAILSWRYSPPYDFYNLEPAQYQADLDDFLNPQNNFLAILHGDGELEGFCFFGSDGRVRGGTYNEPALDIGMGIRPDLTGQGNGRRYAQAVIRYATQYYSPSRLRVTIASFNQRAQRVWVSLGFELVETFVKTNSNQSFVVLVRDMEVRSRK
jgi:ribosomal-protein-alanine N-acetyltransferase